MLKLIPNARQVALRSFSMWAMNVSQAGMGVILFWPQIPEEFKPFLDLQWIVAGVMVCLALGQVGRLVQQFTLPADPADPPMQSFDELDTVPSERQP